MNVNGPRSSSATRNRQRANAREGLEMFNRLMAYLQALENRNKKRAKLENTWRNRSGYEWIHVGTIRRPGTSLGMYTQNRREGPLSRNATYKLRALQQRVNRAQENYNAADARVVNLLGRIPNFRPPWTQGYNNNRFRVATKAKQLKNRANYARAYPVIQKWRNYVSKRKLASTYHGLSAVRAQAGRNRTPLPHSIVLQITKKVMRN